METISQRKARQKLEEILRRIGMEIVTAYEVDGWNVIGKVRCVKYPSNHDEAILNRIKEIHEENLKYEKSLHEAFEKYYLKNTEFEIFNPKNYPWINPFTRLGCTCIMNRIKESQRYTENYNKIQKFFNNLEPLPEDKVKKILEILDKEDE